MIYYRSTRGEDKKIYGFSEALLKGIADDGGLLSPVEIPVFNLKELKSLLGRSYPEKALFVFNLFKMGFPKDTLRKIVYQAYSKNFDNSEVAPVTPLKDNQYVLELWHGPTLAFKDMALQIMPLFFSEATNKSKPLRYLVLVATSGDTGKSALEGFKNKEGVGILVFYPSNRVSTLQERDMITQEGKNVGVCAVEGDFDDAQRCVKEVFNDKEFNRKLLGKQNIILSSANSINWGRLLPQIVYHISGYVDLVQKGVINWGESMDVAVPTGNFGNILAAFYAKKMGLPIGKLICASNENNALTIFLKTGVYNVRNKKIVKTPSPSMDILIPSNLERLLYIITGDEGKVLIWMKDLQGKKKFIVDKKTKEILQSEFYAGWVSNEDCLSNIKRIYKQTSYLMDPHTSVAQLVADRYSKEKKGHNPLVICSTAHWAKFKEVVNSVVNTDKANLHVPKSIKQLKEKPILHKQKCQPNKQALEKYIQEASFLLY